MRTVSIFHIDAFTNRPFGGNPAGVVPDASMLTEKEMQQIARELNLSETAFLMPATAPGIDFVVRYFTPTEEIDFCGHATIGASWIMATEYGWAKKAKKIVFQTNIGTVPVEWDQSTDELKAVVMTQVAPNIKEVLLSTDEIAEVLGLEVADIDERYPVRLGYTGNWHLLVPIRSREAIDHAVPNLSILSQLNKQQGASTTHLFTFDNDDGYDLYTRDFAPAIGIAEDPVTGSANGALAGYLVLEGLLDHTSIQKLTIAQGDAIGRPGRLYVTIIPGESSPIIRVGGSAVPVITGNLILEGV